MHESRFDRRTFLGAGLGGLAALSPLEQTYARTESLQEIARSVLASPTATIVTAREIVTLDPGRPAAQAVACMW